MKINLKTNLKSISKSAKAVVTAALMTALTCQALTPTIVGAATDDPYPKMEFSAKGYEFIDTNHNGTAFVAKIGEKYGMIDSLGKELVEAKYDGYVGPDIYGYTIFYSTHNSARFESDSHGNYINYLWDSYLYDIDGNLVCSAINKEFRSISNGVLEIRDYKAEANITNLYTVKYIDVLNGSATIAECGNVIDSTAFSNTYTVVETTPEIIQSELGGWTFAHETAKIHVIARNGVEIFNKSVGEIFLAADVELPSFKYEGISLSAFPLDYYVAGSTAPDDTLIFFNARTGYNTSSKYFFDYLTGELFPITAGIRLAGGFITSSPSTYSYRKTAMVVSTTIQSTEEKQLVDIATDTVLASYPEISSRSNQYLLVKNDDGKWGYIGIDGTEKEFYLRASDFVDGRAIVTDKHGRTFMINEDFKRISEYTTEISAMQTVLAKKNDGLYYIITNFNDIDDRTGDESRVIFTVGDLRAKVFGEYKYNDVTPIIVKNRTMLPARFVAESLGATVGWNSEKGCVTVNNAEHSIEIYVGSKNAYVDGRSVTLDSEPFIRNSRTYCPIRFILEALGATVEWIPETREIIATP